MTNLFHIDSPFIQFMTKLFDLIILNIVFLLTCIPLVTIGASSVALHSMLLKIINKEEPYIIKGYFQAFKENFVQATKSWFILVLVGMFLYADVCIYRKIGTGGIFMNIVLGAASMLYGCVALYIFPIQARYENKMKENFVNALLLAIRYFPKTILMGTLVIIPIFIALYGTIKSFAFIVIFLFVIGIVVISILQDKILLKIFLQQDALLC